MRPARVSVMHLTWSLVAGGSEMFAWTLAWHLHAQRFSSIMCALDQGGALQEEITRRGVACYVMNRRGGLDWRLPLRLYRLIIKHRVRVIHTHHFNQLFYSALPAVLAGVRIIHTEHDVSQLDRRRIRMALRCLSVVCHRMTAVGVDVAKALRCRVGVSPRKLRIVRAGVDVLDYNVPRDVARRELGLACDLPVALIVARLSGEKNHHLLLEAVRRARINVPNIKLLIAGDGPLRQELAGEIAKSDLEQNVWLMGVRRDVPRLLAACDLFVLCSQREGLPIAVLEAMAAARPVLATAVGDLPRVVLEGQTGKLVASGDGAALAGAMEQMLTQPEHSAKMGLAGRGLVEKEFSLSAMVRRHEAMYLGQPEHLPVFRDKC